MDKYFSIQRSPKQGPFQITPVDAQTGQAMIGRIKS